MKEKLRGNNSHIVIDVRYDEKKHYLGPVAGKVGRMKEKFCGKNLCNCN